MVPTSPRRSRALPLFACMLLPLALLSATLAGADDASPVVRPMEDWEKKIWDEERIPADHWIPALEGLEAMILDGRYQDAEF
ncbi:MAG: hypothetical protein SYC29_01380, partial [Planctomycetota bacterium]|nr:hypothetical protein [Planctomycetota bacterium]